MHISRNRIENSFWDKYITIINDIIIHTSHIHMIYHVIQLFLFSASMLSHWRSFERIERIQNNPWRFFHTKENLFTPTYLFGKVAEEFRTYWNHVFPLMMKIMITYCILKEKDFYCITKSISLFLCILCDLRWKYRP